MKDFNDYFSESKTSLPIIYCDMDGVLADIVAGVGKLYGKSGLNNKNFPAFVDPIKPKIDKEHPHLFANLPAMPDMKQLWSFISKYHTEILSAHTTSWQPNCRADKMTWIKAHLNPLPTKINLVRREQKQDYAMTGGKPNVLIDDWGRNIREWEAKGGIGIHHKTAAETIAKLKELGFG